MPDVLFYFGVDVVPSSTTLSPSQVASYSGFLSSAAASFSSLLSVSPSLLYAVNVTDRATGAAVQVGVVRRLAGGGLGSAGVTVTFVIRLGKTPEQSRVANISATLASPTLTAGALAQVRSSIAAATGVSASFFAVAAPAAEQHLLNAPFSIGSGGGGGTGAGAGGGGAGGSSTVGGTVGGIVAALALACGVWGARSYRKYRRPNIHYVPPTHPVSPTPRRRRRRSRDPRALTIITRTGKHRALPCCRDRARERMVMRSANFEAVEVNNAIAEAERVLQRDDAPLGGGGGSSGGSGTASKKAAVVKKLTEKAERAEAERKRAVEAAAEEVAALRAQLAAAKKADEVDGDEVAELRRQLREAKALAEARAVAPPAAQRVAYAFAAQGVSK